MAGGVALIGTEQHAAISTEWQIRLGKGKLAYRWQILQEGHKGIWCQEFSNPPACRQVSSKVEVCLAVLKWFRFQRCDDIKPKEAF
jgi:hypothetical protein